MAFFGSERVDRRVFLKISALWTTAAALSAASAPRPARAAQRAKAGEYDAVVIGSGLGGLTFAGYMSRKGFKVLVLEHHNVPGGYATTFTRNRGKFTFDVSLHQTVIHGASKQIMEEIGILQKVKFHKVPHLFRLVSPELDISCPAASPRGLEEILIKKYPKEEKGIRGFIGEMVGLSEETERFFTNGKLTIVGKMTFPVKYPLMWAARKKTFADYLNQHVSDPQLRSVLSMFCGYYGLPPDTLSGFYYMIATGGYLRHGGSYPEGGSQTMSNAIAEFIEKGGGEIKYNTRVDKVIVENGRAVGIVTENGETVRARAVVANGSAVRLFNEMIEPEKVPADYLTQIRAYKPSISSFNVWLALNKDVTEKIKDSHIFLGQVLDPKESFERTLQGDAEKSQIGACIYNNIYKEYSPPGTTVLSITAISGYEPWKRFEKDYWAGNKSEYNKRKKEVTDILIARVEEQLIPGLRDMIAVQDAATPLTNARYTLNTAGAIYGFEQSMNNTFMTRLSNRTPIKGLYLAGAWGEPGGGYTGVLMSGKRTFGMLMEDWGKA